MRERIKTDYLEGPPMQDHFMSPGTDASASGINAWPKKKSTSRRRLKKVNPMLIGKNVVLISLW